MNIGLKIIVALLIVIPAYGMNLDISSSGVDQNCISVSYYPGTGGAVDHRVQIDGINGLSNHLRATGGVTYSVSSNGAKSAFKVVGASAITLYHLKAANSISEIWLNVNNADSITAQSYATYLTAYARSNAAVTSASHNAAIDYYGFADTTSRASGILSSYQQAKPGASTGNSPPATPVGAGSPTANPEGAKGSKIVINEEAKNSNGQYAYSELLATDASVPFYEGRAGTTGTAANAISYPDGGFSSYPITSAGTLSMYLYSYDPSTKKYAMATASGKGVTGFSLSYMNASSISGATTANITGINAAGSLVRAVSEYYVGTISGVNKYRMTAEGSGSGTLSGSVSTVSGSKASLSDMVLSGTDYAILQDRRSAGSTVRQNVTVTSSGKAFASTSAASGSSTGAIQNCVDAAGSRDTLNLGPGTYTENVAINKNLNIIGAGRGSTTVNGNQTGSVFTIGTSGIYVTLRGMNITNGKSTYGGGVYNKGIANIDDCIIYSNTASSGGGIYNQGTTTVTSCNISANTASGNGGGIFLNGGTATLTSSSITKNTASSYGGGIIIAGGTTTLTSCNISANTASSSGGGIYALGTVALTGSRISGNTAVNGGGIYQSGGTVTLTSCNITKNTASSAANGGGGIYIGSGTATLTSCNISANKAAYFGGGIYQSGGTATLTSSSISANTASSNGGGIYSTGTVALTGSRISGNTAVNGGGIMQVGSSSKVTVTSSNISGNTASYGGGIYQSGGTSTLTSINISENKATYNGGGIYNGAGTTTLTSSSIYKNTASSTTNGGGGIYNGVGTVALTLCNISSNTAVKNGGGIYQVGASSQVTVTLCNISSNTAAVGGGIYHNSGTAMINGTTSINSNIAKTGNGGGIYSAGSPALSGTGISIAYNKAKSGSATPWYNGYGVYSTSAPTTSDNFNYITQVHDNTPY